MSTSTTNSSFNVTNVSVARDIAIPLIGRFWLFLLSNILSLLCCLFLLYNLLFDRTLRKGLHNHVLIVVIILCILSELIVVPFVLQIYFYGVIWPKIPSFCIFLKFVDSFTYTTTAKLVGWTSIERHILIFHNQLISTKKKRFLIHYFPLITIVIYGIICYGITTPINDCGRRFIYTSTFCGYYSCIYNSVTFSLYEFLTGGVLSSFLIGIGSMTLVLRIIYQKRRFNQQVQWRKHRKMTIQLISIVSLFYILYLPSILLGIAKKLGVPSSVGTDFSLYANFLTYYITFLFPFACLGTLPQLRIRIKNLFQCFYQRQARAIHPQQLLVKTQITQKKTNLQQE